MNRRTNNVNIGEGKVRATVRLEGEECSQDTFEARFYQAQMLKVIHDSPALLECAMAPFQTLRMFHDGAKWVIEAEAIVDAPPSLGIGNGT